MAEDVPLVVRRVVEKDHAEDPLARLEALSKRLDTAQSRLVNALDALEAAHVGVWEWSVGGGGGGELRWDAQMFKMFDVKPGDVKTYADFLNLLREDYKKPVDDALRHSTATGEPYDIQYVTVSGRHIRGRGKCYFVDGKPSRFVGVCMECMPECVCLHATSAGCMTHSPSQ